MLRALLIKDLRRAWRNPLPWLINLALPLCITAIIGLIFGGSSDTGLGRIRFAVVDEDNSPLTRMLRGAMNQDRGGKHLEPVFLDRAEALRQLNKSALSAALIIPTNFTHDYLTGGAAVKFELVKNPAESIHPTVLEELMGVVVTALNAVSRNFQSEFPAFRDTFENEFDYHKVAVLVETTGRKIEAVKQYLSPPLVSYEKNTGDKGETATVAATNLETSAKSPPAAASAKTKTPAKSKGGQASAIFAYLLPGMSAMFLLFIAGNGVTDLLREMRFRTFERYQTLRQRLLPFVLGKMIFAVVLLLFSSAIMLGGGGLAFRVQWQHPLSLMVLILAYACFATALMALFVALMPDERRANMLTNISGMIFGIVGGCMFSREGLPKFLGEHVTPLLPSSWFVDAAHALQFGNDVSLPAVLLKFALVSAVLVAAAVLVFNRRLRSGARL